MKENINYEEINLENLKIYASIRENFWTKVYSDPNLHGLEVEILDSKCPSCSKFIDSKDKSCKHCGEEFTAKIVKVVKKSDGSGKGKKLCNCGFYVAVRTYKCDCGYDFRTRTQDKPKEIPKTLNNKKKKIPEKYQIKDVADLGLFIKNDKICNNYLKIVKDLKYQIEQYKDLLEDDIDGLNILSINENIINYQEMIQIGKSLTDLRNKIIIFNKKLVIDFVNKFYLKSGCKHLKKEDFISAGNEGLIEAINHYDESIKPNINGVVVDKSVSFSTYANFWIKKKIIKEINEKEKEIRIPDYIINEYKDFVTWYNKFKEKNECEPSLDDIMNDRGLKEKKASGFLFTKQYKASIGMSIDDVNKFSDSESEPKKGHTNLKFNAGSLDTFKLTDSIEEEHFELSKIDWSKIKFKNARYKEVFFKLRGLFGYKELTVSDVHHETGVTPITIRKIETKTIHQIRRQLGIIVEIDEEENEE